MGNPNQIARIVARRQKRLIFWRENLSGTDLESTQKASIDGYLNDYQQLLQAYTKAGSQSEIDSCESEVDNLERKIEGFFESRRLLTSSIGIAAIEDT
jgi:hypothetical protein